MHFLNLITVFVLLLLVGAEFSVSAFVHPSVWRLEPAPQATMLGHYAAVLGKVMPFWYGLAFALVVLETWLCRHTTGFGILVAAGVILLLTILATLLFLVPLNNRVVEGAAGWQAIHRTWDGRHRVRIFALAVASILLTYVLVR